LVHGRAEHVGFFAYSIAHACFTCPFIESTAPDHTTCDTDDPGFALMSGAHFNPLPDR
jgi:hypothetical protein